MTELLLACIAFVGTHFLLSHPLRAPLVGKMGEGPFLGVYSLVALVTLLWMAYAFYMAPKGVPLWNGWSDVLWIVATILMLLASILFVGSHKGNPAAPSPGKPPASLGRAADGVFAITRHPMMWSFALWGIAHIMVMPTPANIILTGSIIILALGGCYGQDRKKEKLLGDAWSAWEARTSYFPFASQFSGKAPWSAALPSRRLILIGIILWLVATLAHGGIGAGVWRWLL